MTNWRILIPVKSLATAKTRTGLDLDDRRALTLAMLRDVLAVARGVRGVEEVVICTSDPQVCDEFPRESIWFTSGQGDLNADLNEALGDSWSERRRRPTCVVVGDLPCVRRVDLEIVLRRADRDSAAFVASLDGGTTVLAAHDPRRMHPSFGSGSAARHRRWYKDISREVGLGCRLDVDTLDALAWGMRVGLGRETEARVREMGGLDHYLDFSEPQLQSGR